MSWLDGLLPILALLLSAAILIMSELLSKEVKQDEVAVTKDAGRTINKRL